MPTLRIADDDALNAFATGMNPKQYSITVTRGLIDSLDDRELEAVLGHELTHIRNGDVRMMVIAVVMAGVISFFGEMVFRIFFQSAFYGGFGGRRRGGDSEGKGGAGIAIVIAIALIAVAWVLSVVIRFALSRQREYLADAGSVELTKDPDAMIIGAAQDRGARRACPRQFGGDGNVRRQSARGLFQYFRHPSADRCARRGAGEICRRPRSRPAGAAGTSRRRSRRARLLDRAAAPPEGPGATAAERQSPTSRSCRSSRRRLGSHPAATARSLGSAPGS